jgi:hypothetical protein
LFVDVFIASCRYLRYCERRTLSFTRIATFLTHPFQLGIALLLLSRCLLYKVILVLHSIYYRYHVLIFLFDLSRYIYFEFPNANTVFKKIGRWRLITRSFMPALVFIVFVGVKNIYLYIFIIFGVFTLKLNFNVKTIDTY